jgi:transposase
MKKTLNSPTRQSLEAAYQAARDKRTANKINILLLLDDGYSYQDVSAILRLDESTVRRHEKYFHLLGALEYLKNPFSGGVCKLDGASLETLEKFLDENLCESTDEAISFIENEFGIIYTRAGMAALLHRLGFVFKKPVLVPGKIDNELQEAFIDYYNRLKLSMGADDKMYFLDGVHPQFNTQAGYGWIRKGRKKELKSQAGRQRVNLNGAFDPVSLEVIIRADDTLNAQSTIELLKMIEEQNPKSKKIVLFVDNALYYYNGDVVEYANNSRQLVLVYLPTYSPNLNLIERLWRFMKRKVLYNKYHENFQEFKNSLGNFFQKLPSYYDELSEIMNEEFQTFKI